MDFNPEYPQDKDKMLPQHIEEEASLAKINNKSIDINKLLNGIIKKNIITPLGKTGRRNRRIEKELYDVFWNNLEPKEKIKLYELSLHREIDLANFVFKTYNDMSKNDLLKKILLQDASNPLSSNPVVNDKIRLVMEAVRRQMLDCEKLEDE